jgi:hypothetical protein
MNNTWGTIEGTAQEMAIHIKAYTRQSSSAGRRLGENIVLEIQHL